MKRLFVLFLPLVLALMSCGDKEEIQRLTDANTELAEKIASLEAQLKPYKESYDRFQFLARKLKGIKARIVTNHGDIEVAFFPDKAPLHCFNFITRAESGFYDNIQFHRVISGFMIQAGDPNSKDEDPYNDGIGGPIAMIPHEFNDTNHVPGILSMARTGNVGAGAGSQFFIVHGNAAHLNNQYTAFGKVTKGIEVVNKIAAIETNKKDRRLQDRPVKPAIIKEIQVYR